MQAPVETHLYMELPQGIETKYGTSKDHVLKLLANLYGHKSKLVEYGTNTSWTNWQVSGSSNWQWMRILSFYCDDIIFIVYVDVGIFLGPSAQVLTQVLWEIKNTSLDIEDQGYPSDYVGVNVHKQADGMYNFTQRTLIDAIILDVGLKDKYTKPVPAKASLHLHAFKNSPTFDEKFHYRSIVGKLNYLAQTTRPDIMYATCQIAKYSSDPQKEQWSNYPPHQLLTLYSWSRPQVQTKSKKGIWLFLWCRILRRLEQIACPKWSKYCKIP